MGHGYETTSVAEIRNILKNTYGVDDETLQQTKKALVELLIAYNTSGVKKEEIKIEKLVGNDARGPVVKMPEYNDIYISPEALEDIKNWGNEDIPEEGDLDEEVEEDYLDSLVETPYDISSFNDLEVEVSEDNTINIEGFEEVLDRDLEDDVEEEEEDIPVVQTNNIDNIPHYTSPEWSDYLISQLRDDELYEKYPKLKGLRRLCEKFIGPIVSKEVMCNKCPDINGNSSTITVKITCKVLNKNHPLYKTDIVEMSISDANSNNNTTSPYSYHMSSISEARSESRCYRNILRVNVITAEEANSGMNIEESSDDDISQIQVMAIDLVAKRNDINVIDYINSGSSGKKYDSINDISRNDASKMIEVLNKISAEEIKRPDTIGKYDPNWKNK